MPPPATLCFAAGCRSLAALQVHRPLHRALQTYGGLAELRLDRYSDLGPRRLAATVECLTPQRLLLSCRGRAARPAYVALAARLGVAYLDLDLQDLPRLDFVPGPRRVISRHYPGAPPLEDLLADVERAQALGAELIKLVIRPRHIADLVPLMQLAKRGARPGVALLLLATGALGQFTRVLVPTFMRPAPFSFARPDGAGGTAAGQLSGAQMAAYNYFSLRRGAQIYGIVGTQLRDTLSPGLHNALLRQRGANATYLPFTLGPRPADFTTFIERLAPLLGLRGLSVTQPHKVQAARCARHRDAGVARCGAANTLLRQGRHWRAFNTDALAAAALLRRLRRLPGLSPSLWILGAGGLARAVLAAARGWTVYVSARRPDQLAELQRAFPRLRPLAWGARPPRRQLGVLVQCTSAQLDLPDGGGHAILPAKMVIWEMIYAPRRTQLVQQACARQLRVIDGLQLFLRQAAAQAAIFFGNHQKLCALFGLLYSLPRWPPSPPNHPTPLPRAQAHVPPS